VSDDEHSAATHSSRTEPVQRPYREPAAWPPSRAAVRSPGN